MDKNSDFNGGFAITLTLLAAITGSYFFLNSPLVSLRPDQGSVIYDPTSESQFVRARLWQDPLLAAYDDWKNRSKDGAPLQPNDPLPHLIFKLPENLVPRESEPTLRLLVMQGEETYVENIEQRRRQRYALISALTRENYVPDDEAHLGYFLAPQFDPDETDASGSTSTMLIAHETFEHFAEPGEDAAKSAKVYAGPTKIHVLWLNSTDFDEHTLVRLTGLLTYMDYCKGSKCEGTARDVTNVILGPNSTGELTAMYEQGTIVTPGRLEEQNRWALRYFAELKQKALQFEMTKAHNTAVAQSDTASSSDAAPDNLQNFLLYEKSPEGQIDLAGIKKSRQGLIFIPSNVTGPLDVVLKDDKLAIAVQEKTQEVENMVADRLGIKMFRSTILRDDLVLGKLLQELDNRGICYDYEQRDAPGDGQSARQADNVSENYNIEKSARIYVISEQDTLYGRILDDLILKQRKNVGCALEVVEIGYLRGIDGEMPLSDANKTAEKSTPAEQEQSQDNQGQTVAELFAPPGKERRAGPAQLDYISGLADRIMKDVGKQSGPIAIGVLGSDVYDKLLILQSLKSRLPFALFFTTDLDSRLSGREVYKWTRNLLIGSSHNLAYDVEDGTAEAGARKSTDGNNDSPAFRDAYQTSFFQATVMALGYAAADGNSGVPDIEIKPRLFEIGRTGPLELTPRKSGNTENLETGAKPLEGQVREDPRVLFDKLPVPVRFLLCLPLLMFLAWALVMRCTEPDARMVNFLQGRRSNYFRIYAFDKVITVSVVAILFKLLFLRVVTVRGSEPLYLFEGVSVYPVLSLQLSTIVMAVAMISITRGRLLQAKIELERRFGIETKVVSSHLTKKVNGDRPLSIHELWFFCTGMTGITKALRSTLVTAVSASVIVLYLLHISSPDSLFTGKLQFSIGGSPGLAANWLVPVVRGLSLFSVLLMYFICIYVYDFACRLMCELSRREIYGWNDTSRPAGIANPKLAMDLIVDITKIVTPIIYYPFFLLTMLLVSRNSLFEGWIQNWFILLVFVGFVVYIFFQAARFQMRAGEARNQILEKLKNQKINRLSNSYNHSGQALIRSASNSTPAALATKDKAYDSLLDQTIEDIKGMHSGAFVHWTSHPLFKAVALPSSSLGILTVLLQ